MRRQWLSSLFAIDTRSLALFRVALGLLLVADLITRSLDLRAFYTDDGVLPVALLPLATDSALSLHAHASAWPLLVWLLFALHLAAALALCVGFRTRVASVVCWLLLASLQLRNPPLSISGGDKILCLLLFWSMFLPLGARFSWDERRSATTGAGEVLSVASAALLLQVGLIYWSNGLNKLAEEAWIRGTALEYALAATFFGGPLGPWLAAQPWLMAPGSWATVAFELLMPCLAFVPWRNDVMRLATVSVFLGFHVLLAAAFSIGSFPLACIVAWLAFLPRLFWDALSRRVPALGGAATRQPQPPRALELLCGALLVYVFAHVVAGHLHVALPRPFHAAGAALQLDQHWSQFADVQPFDFWPTLHGTTAAGASVDPLLGTPPLHGHPGRAADRFPSFRWRIYVFGLIRRAMGGPATPELEALTGRFADVLCQRWNAGHAGGERLTSLRVAFVAEYLERGSYLGPTELFAVERRCDVEK